MRIIILAEFMTIFLSTYQNKVDKKGRVSIPSTFRAVLAKEDFSGIIAYPSFVNPCVEGCGMSRIERISEAIDIMDPYSEERDAFAASILGGSEQLNLDKDGRITLSEDFRDKTGITDKVVFVGKGQTFEIWNPEEFEKYSEKARNLAKEKRGKLSLAKNNNENINK